MGFGMLAGGLASGFAAGATLADRMDESERKRKESESRLKTEEIERGLKQHSLDETNRKVKANSELAEHSAKAAETANAMAGGETAYQQQAMTKALGADESDAEGSAYRNTVDSILKNPAGLVKNESTKPAVDGDVAEPAQPEYRVGWGDLKKEATKGMPSWKTGAELKYSDAVDRARILEKHQQFDAAKKLRDESTKEAANAAYSALIEGDYKTVARMMNVYPDGRKYQYVSHGDDGNGNQTVTFDIDGTQRTIPVEQMERAIYARANPEKAQSADSTKRLWETRLESQASRQAAVEAGKDARNAANNNARMGMLMERLRNGGGARGSKGVGGSGAGRAGDALKLEDAKFYGEALESSLGEAFKGTPLFAPAQRYMAEIVANNPDVGRNSIPRLAEDSANIADIQAWQSFTANPANKGKPYVSPRGHQDMAKLAAQYKLNDELDPDTGMVVKTYTSLGDANGIDPVKYRMSGARPLPDSMVEGFNSQLGNKHGWAEWDKKASDLVKKHSDARTRAELVKAFSMKFGGSGNAILQNYLKAARKQMSDRQRLKDAKNIRPAPITEADARAREDAAMERAKKEAAANSAGDEYIDAFNFGN